jgi:hypothetical protein
MPDKSSKELQSLLGKSIGAAEARTPGPKPTVGATTVDNTSPTSRPVPHPTGKRPTSQG